MAAAPAERPLSQLREVFLTWNYGLFIHFNIATINEREWADCGRVLESEDAHIDTLNDCATRRLGFRPVRQTLKIEASCEQLRINGRCQNLIATRLSGKRLRKKR